MGEFEEVGNTVKGFASDNATVVVGTVIDPGMDDEIRVTVVATGIGCEPRAKDDVPTVTPVRKAEPEATDYGSFERPTVIRNRGEKLRGEPSAETGTDYLDIPAFLRRQAD